MSSREHEQSLAKSIRDFDAALYAFSSDVFKRLNHNRFLIACVQGLSRALAWAGGYRDDANDKN